MVAELCDGCGYVCTELCDGCGYVCTELCDGCVARRLQEEEEDQFTFDQATIFVRKVLAPLPYAATDPESTLDEEDPDFMEVRKGDHRQLDS